MRMLDPLILELELQMLMSSHDHVILNILLFIDYQSPFLLCSHSMYTCHLSEEREKCVSLYTLLDYTYERKYAVFVFLSMAYCA